MNTLHDLDGSLFVRATAQDGEPPYLTFVSASGFSTGGSYYPAESVCVSGLEAVAELRDLCEALIEAHAEQTQRTLPLQVDPDLGRPL